MLMVASMSTSPAAPPSVRPRRVVTDRRGGRSRSPYDTFNLGDHVGDDPADVAANRGRVARELGVPEDRLVWMNQVHGTGVAVVDGPQAGPVPATDALVTATPRSRPLRARGRLRADPAGRPRDRCGRRRARGPRGGPPGRRPGRPVRHGEPGGPRPARDRPAGPRGLRRLLRGAGGDAGRRGPRGARLPPSAPGGHPRAWTSGRASRRSCARPASPRSSTTRAAPSRTRTLFSHRRDGVTGRQAGLVWLG